MKQTGIISQYNIDKSRFADIFSKFTGISRNKISAFLGKNPASLIFEHPASLGVSEAQLRRIGELKELRNLYINLKSHDKEYLLNSSQKAGEYFREYFTGVKDKEYFVCAFLDNSNRILTTKVMSTGTVDQAAVYPREIAKTALMYDAKSVIIAHNHPGKSCEPSDADKCVHQKIAEALGSLQIKLLDNIIVSGEKYFSFAEYGMNNISMLYARESDPVYMRISRRDRNGRETTCRSKDDHLFEI